MMVNEGFTALADEERSVHHIKIIQIHAARAILVTHTFDRYALLKVHVEWHGSGRVSGFLQHIYPSIF